MTSQPQTIEETKPGTKKGQRLPSRAAKDQFDYWKSRVRHRKFKKGDADAQIRHLQLRMKHAGKEGWFNLGTENRTEATKKAMAIYGFVKVNGWEAANARFKPKPEKYSRSPTLAEFFAAVREYSDLSNRTFSSYSRKFRSIVASIFGIKGSKAEKFCSQNSRLWRERVDSIELASVTPQKIDGWRKSYIGRHSGNYLAQKRAKHSADSAIRCSKALFGKKIRPKLVGFPLPSPLPFDGVTVGQVHNPYESDINPHNLMSAAERELRTQHPEAYKIFLLSLHVGLRRNETDKLRWDSINWDTQRIRIETTATFAAKTEGSEAAVPMNDIVKDALLSFRPEFDRGYVIESKIAPRTNVTYNHYRANSHFVTLIDWLKKKGVRARCPIHTLRKELGSIVSENMNLVAAQKMLRHKDITTTGRYYSAVKRDIGDMLTAFMKVGLETTPPPVESGSKPDSARGEVLASLPAPTGIMSFPSGEAVSQRQLAG